MSQYLVLERVKVQNANAVSGFTWGFPAITNFLGFVHNLNRKIKLNTDLNCIILSGCSVIAHEQHVHSYKDGSSTRFSQYKTSHFMSLPIVGGRLRDPAINEEAKMNMTVSLLIPIKGYLGGLGNELKDFVDRASHTQRLAGGTVLSVKSIKIVDLDENEQLKKIRRKMLPGFILLDRSKYLEEHFFDLQKFSSDAGLLDAWFDFVALKQVARPECNLIDKYLSSLAIKTEHLSELNEIWLEHKLAPYQLDNIPNKLINYFNEQQENINAKILDQWRSYLYPHDKTVAAWEYIKKPRSGYLVPLMVGYKAITDVYPAGEIYGSRDAETDLSFVESVHTIGEWQSVHRLTTPDEWHSCVWNYTYEKDWYLCCQVDVKAQAKSNDLASDEAYY